MELKLERGASHEQGRSAMEKHMLGRAELMDTYENKSERALNTGRFAQRRVG
jgi:hypothetical protein